METKTKKKMSKGTKKLLINISVLVVLIGITVTVLCLSYRELNFANIWAFLTSSKPMCIVAAFLCMLAFIVFEGLALYVIARRLGHKSKLRGAMAYSSADVYYSAITPSASGGQPASLFYMVRDGMSAGVAGFTLIFNLMAYTAAIIVMGIFAFIVRPGIFSSLGSGLAQTLVIVGFVLQALLLGFFIMCILWHKALLKVGNGTIKLLHKIKIIKKPDKWRDKWAAEVEKYRASREIISAHPGLFMEALLLNLIQRVSQTFIPCFICYGASDNASFLDLFAMQTYVLLGYNMIPLPGGVGAYEYMYLNTFCIAYDEAFILSAMMVSRAISYYACMIVSGVYTLVYHSLGIRGKKGEDSSPGEEKAEGEDGAPKEPDGDTADGDGQTEPSAQNNHADDSGGGAFEEAGEKPQGEGAEESEEKTEACDKTEDGATEEEPPQEDGQQTDDTKQPEDKNEVKGESL